MDFDLKGELIYLSSPYTHEDQFVREIRFLEACKATAWVINVLRLNAVGAMVHSHPLVTRYNLPVEWEFWANYDTAIIKAAREVWVLCSPGWTNSMGVTTECKIAREMGKKIRYMVPSNSGRMEHYVVTTIEPDEEQLYGRIEPGRLGHPPFKAE
jgi:hypothetical protein